ncbi:MAG: zinc ribbon domain-containing protein [Propionicimonas sp.]|uniref:FmdB family zinc ribbon protein n=1 Tax=Propionicimonas sp. TaxID=1955623 RepID=UPI003D0B1C90
MPTYQYRCTACNTELEVVQKFTDDPLTECPECDGNLRKVFNAVGVVFKGSGFYATDNRSKGKAAAARSGDSGPAKSEGGSAAKSEGSGSSSDTSSSSKVSTPTSSSGSSSTGASSAA